MADLPVELCVLIVDFLDSYTYNIPSWLRKCTASRLRFNVVPYTKLTELDLEAITREYDGVVLSAGPGTVDNPNDLGDFTPALLRNASDIPIFGICLGFQAICKEFGGVIAPLPSPHHGVVSDLLDAGGRTIGHKATRYHSLEVKLGSVALENLEILAFARNVNDTGYVTPTRSTMEVRHKYRPIWAVQYHPESVCSQKCDAVVQPFVQAVQDRCKVRHAEKNAMSTPRCQAPSSITPVSTSFAPSRKVLWEKLESSVDLVAIARQVGAASDFVLLESASKGEWSILSATSSASSFRYCLRKRRYTLSAYRDSAKFSEARDVSIEHAWRFLSNYSSRTRYFGGPPNVPFWGGWMGYFSYEMGLAQLGIDPYPDYIRATASDSEDFHLLWSTETILHHKASGATFLVSLQQDQQWIDRTKSMLHKFANASPCAPESVVFNPMIRSLDMETYLGYIDQCQHSIRAGDSYELCLTSATTVESQEQTAPADLYEGLRTSNPAEFMCLMQLGGVDFVSASPEEFMSFDPDTRKAEMKPIKGTLPKRLPDGSAITLEDAQRQLQTPKVKAENLMIVDLVRNDLSKVSDAVACSKLFHVEELETMYQLISDVEAEVRPDVTAWDLLQATLPPGSMTGAPKHRSCEILQKLEGAARGLYSGVVGYIDVRGHCRTSVSIRNAIRYPREKRWRVGAGGAITSMSDPTEEWLERKLKAASVLGAFQPRFDLLETFLYTADEGFRYWNEHMERLTASLEYFKFAKPFSDSADPGYQSEGDDWQGKLQVWAMNQLKSVCDQSAHRVSLTLSPGGTPALKVLQIESTAASQPVNVYLDPQALSDVRKKEPFITHKTTNRAYYTAARERVNAEGRDEVLLFAHLASSDLQEDECGESDLLLEGSYTNVAVFEESRQAWITPRFGCLPGIERSKLIAQGSINEGEVHRSQLPRGTKVMLFNSVRGCFDGLIQ